MSKSIFLKLAILTTIICTAYSMHPDLQGKTPAEINNLYKRRLVYRDELRALSVEEPLQKEPLAAGLHPDLAGKNPSQINTAYKQLVEEIVDLRGQLNRLGISFDEFTLTPSAYSSPIASARAPSRQGAGTPYSNSLSSTVANVDHTARSLFTDEDSAAVAAPPTIAGSEPPVPPTVASRQAASNQQHLTAEEQHLTKVVNRRTGLVAAMFSKASDACAYVKDHPYLVVSHAAAAAVGAGAALWARKK